MTIAQQRHVFTPYGAAAQLYRERSGEVVLSGAAGTGKSVGVLHRVHLRNLLNRNTRGLIVRKTARSLSTSALKTWERDVVNDALRDGSVSYYGGSAREPAQYRYSNGSSVALGGMDDPLKIMSTEYDWIYAQECTELDETDWEMASSRLRNGAVRDKKTGVAVQQLFGDCNPDHPNHWVLDRERRGVLKLLVSHHEDNPRFFHRDGTMTPDGEQYMARLDALTGVRYLRLRKGIWAAAEGVIYEHYDPALHVIDPFPVPDSWERVWSIDFGYTNPFVWQDWALDEDRRAYLVREVYMSGRLVEDHARQIMALGGPSPSVVVCDHDAEDRATWERHTGLGTVPAHKAVNEGIELVAARFKLAGDGRPRISYFRDALVERDQSLVAKKLPTCTADETPAYIWAPEPPGADRKERKPVKKNDHGKDAERYFVADIDLHGSTNVRWG